MDFDKDFLGRLFEQAIESPRLRQSFDLRTSSSDSSQRILNALFPGTVVPIHRHPNTSETVVCLCGKMDEVNLIQIKKFQWEPLSQSTAPRRFPQTPLPESCAAAARRQPQRSAGKSHTDYSQRPGPDAHPRR